MNFRKTTRALCLLGAALAVSAPLFAGSPAETKKMDVKMSPEQEAMMAAWAKVANPGDQHKWLMSRAGSWNTVNKHWMSPGMPPEESKGTCEAKAILGGRFLQEEYSGEMMGEAFMGLGITGYDNYKKKFVSSWIDNMGTMMMVSEGDLDAAKKTLTLSATYDDPVSGKVKTMKMTSRMEGANRIVWEGWDTAPDGKPFKMMEIVYTRK